MKALSIRQPWAWLIVNGFKDVENRTWHTEYAGPLLIHAGKKMTQDDWMPASLLAEDELQIELPEDLGCDGGPASGRLGGIVGFARMTGCGGDNLVQSPWNVEGQWHFTLTDARPVSTFVPFKGALGFFDVPYPKALEAFGPPASLSNLGDGSSA